MRTATCTTRPIDLIAALLLILGCCLVALPLLGQERDAPATPDPEARLLEAELLELGEGKIEDAIEIYRALLARDDLSAILHARTLFSIARAHRKRGELGAANERYEELIAAHPDNEKLVDASRRYLTEIEDGADRLPEFDWLVQVEQNPEIQAQIFEWGMQLVGSSASAAFGARRRLQSLGVVVVPVLEPMLENSRDAGHRYELARILIGMGRVQHIPVLIESNYEQPANDSLLASMLQSQSAEDLGEALRILESYSDSDEPRARWMAATTRLYLGSWKRLEEDLRTVVTLQDKFRDDDWNHNIPFSAHPEGLARIRDLLLEVVETSFSAYEQLLQEILRNAPDLVRQEDLNPLSTVGRQPMPDTLLLLHQERRAHLLSLLEGANAPVLLGTLRGSRETYYDDDWKALGPDFPAVQRARIFRACRLFDHLLALALEDDTAVPVFEDFLRNRIREVDPNKPWVGAGGAFRPMEWVRYFATRSSKVVGSARGRRGNINPPTVEIIAPVVISFEMEAAMRRIFASDADMVTRGLALEILLRAYREGRAESRALLREVLEDPNADPPHRFVAFVGLFLRLPDGGETRDADAERLDRFFAEANEPGWKVSVGEVIEDQDGRTRRLNAGRTRRLNFGSLEFSVRYEGISAPDLLSIYLSHLERVRDAEEFSDRTGLALEESIPRGWNIEIYQNFDQGTRANLPHPWTSHFLLAADRIEDPDILRKLSSEIFNASQVAEPVPAAALTRLLQDPQVPADLRSSLLNLLAQQSKEYSNLQEFLEGLDWRALLMGTDTVGGAMVRYHGNLEKYLHPHRDEARRSPQSEVLLWAWNKAPLPDRPEDLETLFSNSDERVRDLGYELLMKAEEDTWLPALHRAIEVAPTKSRLNAIERLAFFAAPESLAPLTKLLNDPVFAVRAAALDALERIEETLAQREKWKKRFGEKAADGGGGRR